MQLEGAPDSNENKMLSNLIPLLALAFPQYTTGTDDFTVTVDAKANIFASDLVSPPQPGGGGGGLFPTEITLPPIGKERVVVFPEVAGLIAAGDAQTFALHGPDGYLLAPSNVHSFSGVAGIKHDTNAMFLTGVFLESVRQTTNAPNRLDATLAETTDSFAPTIGQIFAIGDGRLGTGSLVPGAMQVFKVPPTATRLLLGFADAWDFVGPTGYYDDNRGQLNVSIRVASSDTGLFLLGYAPGAFGQTNGNIILWGADPIQSHLALVEGDYGRSLIWGTWLDLSHPKIVSTARPDRVPWGDTRRILVMPRVFPRPRLLQLYQWDSNTRTLRLSNTLIGMR